MGPLRSRVIRRKLGTEGVPISRVDAELGCRNEFNYQGVANRHLQIRVSGNLEYVLSWHFCPFWG
jgi:hypothetical protein